ncbi:hypothetical protein C1645_879069 [Glomus cerebriforme]|uniref:Uncharacterized protein n=1 Tax=Glomus cerebriforme TaxID=658196 RepID=A0A397S7W7_9GLOM|nr:hypothetical protein C1645_837882 [Glomus cerebriforme]RIA85793.1 hypothetical protein C1645_879069 [Glomus cerebriforme]
MTKEKWNKLTESKSAILFVLTSVVQAVVLTYLQSKIFARNVYGWINIHPDSNDNTIIDACFSSTNVETFMILSFECIMFIFLNIFQLYSCINAVLHKNTIQIFMISLTNFCYAILGAVQFVEAIETKDKITYDCPTVVFDPEIMIHEVPNIIIITLLSCVMGYLSFKLYQQFGWIIYKKIGSDIQMQSRYRTRLIFLMLLKLNLLMLLLFSILIVPYYINGPNKTLVYAGFIFFVTVFLFNVLAFKSITKEYKNGMIAFLSFWVLVMGVYAWFCYIGFSIVFSYRLYIGLIFGIFFLIFGVLTFVIGISVTNNFGKGLKEYLMVHKEGIKKVEEYEINYNNNEKGKIEIVGHGSSKKNNDDK